MEKTIVCIITNDKGEILLQKKTTDYKRFPGRWCLFGGGAESEEMDKEMKREIMEELGVDISVKFLFNFNYEDFEQHVFSSSLNDLSELSIGEGAGIAFFAKEELDKLSIIPESYKAIKMFFRSLN